MTDAPDLHCTTINVRRPVPHLRRDHPDAWASRRPALAAFLDADRPTLLAVQEAVPAQLDTVRAALGNRWQAVVEPDWARLEHKIHPGQFSTARRSYFRQNIVNREFIREEKDFPAVQCFARGLDFLERNRESDGWLLQIETFDPHEPFTAPERFKQAFKTGWNGPVRDWPRYGRV